MIGQKRQEGWTSVPSEGQREEEKERKQREDVTVKDAPEDKDGSETAKAGLTGQGTGATCMGGSQAGLDGLEQICPVRMFGI